MNALHIHAQVIASLHVLWYLIQHSRIRVVPHRVAVDLHTKSGYTVTASNWFLHTKNGYIGIAHKKRLHRHNVKFDFAQQKRLHNNLCTSKTVTTTHLQTNNNIQWNSATWQCFCTVTIEYNMLLTLLLMLMLMFHRYSCATSVTSASYGSGKEFGYGIVTEILRKHMDKMGKVFTKILSATLDRWKLHQRRLWHFVGQTLNVRHILCARA